MQLKVNQSMYPFAWAASIVQYTDYCGCVYSILWQYYTQQCIVSIAPV